MSFGNKEEQIATLLREIEVSMAQPYGNAIDTSTLTNRSGIDSK
jgi:hypothetical protein